MRENDTKFENLSENKKKSDLWHAHNIIFSGVNTRQKKVDSAPAHDHHRCVALKTSTIIGSIKQVFCNMHLPFGLSLLLHPHIIFALSSKKTKPCSVFILLLRVFGELIF